MRPPRSWRSSGWSSSRRCRCGAPWRSSESRAPPSIAGTIAIEPASSPMWNVGSVDLQLRLNGRPDLGTERSYRALPKALDLGLAVGGLGRREKRKVEIAPRQRPRDDRIAVRAGTADFWFFGQQDLKWFGLGHGSGCAF